MKLKNKFGQAEMFGLIFIVMIVSVGILLLAKSQMNQSTTEIKQEYDKTQLATNTMNTLIKTRTYCGSYELGDLYVDWAKNPSNPKIECVIGDNIYTSKEYATQVTQYVLDETLGEWKKPYYFNMSVDGKTLEIFSSDVACPASRKSESVPLPLHPGLLTLEMWICD